MVQHLFIGPLYKMSLTEMVELKKKLDELMAKGFIRKSNLLGVLLCCLS